MVVSRVAILAQAWAVRRLVRNDVWLVRKKWRARLVVSRVDRLVLVSVLWCRSSVAHRVSLARAL